MPRPSGEPSWPSPGHAWYVVGVLTFAYLVSYADRQILTLLIQPIRHDLGISDTQVSLLSGFAFVILYTFVGIPIGWLADNRSRRVIIAVGATAWSLMTALCGLARTFGQLFLARVGVGIGEATLTPSAFSMIADYFPPHRLGRAMGVYMSGAAVGAGLALVAGGAVIMLVEKLPQIVLPVIGEIRPWQLAFIFVAIPGLLVAILMMTGKEPFRQGRMKVAGELRGGVESISMGAGLTYIVTHWRTYAPLFGGFAMLSLMKNGLLTWTPTMYIRSYGWSASAIGFTFGIFLLAFAPLGGIGGGWIADRLRQRNYVDAPVRVLIVTIFLLTPVAALMPLMPTAASSLVLLAILPLLLFVIGALVPTAFQLVTPNQLRGQVTAYSLFIVTLLGEGLGPLVVALITDYGFGDDLALRYSISIVAVIFAPLSGLIFWSGLKSYRSAAMAANRRKL